MQNSKPETKKKPHKPLRGRPGGDESRGRILSSAGQLFAERGFNGVSTRELAKEAGVNVSAIAYYFRGKKGLYRAVFNQLIEDTNPFFQPTAAHIRESVVAANGDRKALAELTRWLIKTLLNGVLNEGPMQWQMGLMLREYHQPTDGFAILLEHRVNPMHDAVAGLVAAATGKDAEDPETLLLTCCLIGQCMAFGAARGLVLARLNWMTFSADNMPQVVDTVTGVALAMLGFEDEA
jgi:AcrR family transcriptional regulator